MKSKTFFDIKIFELTNKERDSLLLTKSHRTTAYKGNFIHQITDGQVVYELTDVKNYLFDSQSDFYKFIEKTATPQVIGEFIFSYTHPVKDSTFIEKINDYIVLFTGANEVVLNLRNIDDLKKVDSLLNRWEMSEFRKFRLSLIALVGEFVLNKLGTDDAGWKYFNYSVNGKSERNPAIIFKGKTIIDPATIVNDQYNNKIKNPRYEINLYKATQEMIAKIST
jgi:hypothetical protein